MTGPERAAAPGTDGTGGGEHDTPNATTTPTGALLDIDAAARDDADHRQHWYEEALELIAERHSDPDAAEIRSELEIEAEELAARRGPAANEARERFLADLRRAPKPLDRMPQPRSASARKPGARDQVIDLAETRYDIGRTEDGRAYLVPDDGPNVALLSGQAKAHLARTYRSAHGASVARNALDEAWQTIEGLADDFEKSSLPLRVAEHDATLVVDLGDTSGRCIIVTAGRWTIADRSPVTFRRSKALLPLPVPEAGGTVDELFDLLPIAEPSRDLFAAWLVSALFAELPHPAPVFRGEQGAAKTTTARLTSRLLDPCMADTQKPPKTDDDWSHSCSARWMIAVDNVSHVSEWWSDALCRTITGDGWLRRKLYEDDDVVVTKWRRCVILNGISLGAALRPDLAERLVFFELNRPAEYLTEAEVNERFDAMRARVLGALLDQAAAVLARRPHVEPVRDLRMADFAHLLAAYDDAHDTNALGTYRGELDNAFEEAVASDPLATAVIAFMDDRDEWVGTAANLLALLGPHRPDAEGEWWPKTAHALSSTMTRSAPALRRLGITWQKPTPTGRDRRRVARLTRMSERGEEEPWA